MVACYLADAGGNGKFGAGEEYRHEAAHDQVVDFLLGFGQCARLLQGGDDGEVVAYLAVVKDAARGLDVAFVDGGLRMGSQMALAASRQHGKGFVGYAYIVGRQVA